MADPKLVYVLEIDGRIQQSALHKKRIRARRGVVVEQKVVPYVSIDEIRVIVQTGQTHEEISKRIGALLERVWEEATCG